MSKDRQKGQKAHYFRQKSVLFRKDFYIFFFSADLLDYNRKYLIREGDLKNTGIIKNEDGTRRSSRSSTVIQVN